MSTITADQIINNAVTAHPMLFVSGKPDVDAAAIKAWAALPLGEQNWHLGALQLANLVATQVAMAQRHHLAETMQAQVEALTACVEAIAALGGGTDLAPVEAKLDRLISKTDLAPLIAKVDGLLQAMKRTIAASATLPPDVDDKPPKKRGAKAESTPAEPTA